MPHVTQIRALKVWLQRGISSRWSLNTPFQREQVQACEVAPEKADCPAVTLQDHRGRVAGMGGPAPRRRSKDGLVSCKQCSGHGGPVIRHMRLLN